MAVFLLVAAILFYILDVVVISVAHDWSASISDAITKFFRKFFGIPV